MDSGKFDQRMAVKRRPIDANNVRGDFALVFTTWAQVMQFPPRVRSPDQAGGIVEDAVNVVARVRDCSQNRTITNADRVAIQGSEFAVLNAGLPVRIGQFIELILSRQLVA